MKTIDGYNLSLVDRIKKKITSKQKHFVVKLKKKLVGNILITFSQPKEPLAIVSCLFYLCIHINFYFSLFFLFTVVFSMSDKLSVLAAKENF